MSPQRDPKIQHRLDVYSAHYDFATAAWGTGIALVVLGFLLGLVVLSWKEHLYLVVLVLTTGITTYQYARALPELLRRRIQLQLQYEHTYGHPVTFDPIVSPLIYSIKAYWKRAPRHRQ